MLRNIAPPSHASLKHQGVRNITLPTTIGTATTQNVPADDMASERSLPINELCNGPYSTPIPPRKKTPPKKLYTRSPIPFKLRLHRREQGQCCIRTEKVIKMHGSSRSKLGFSD
ncbi:hypothetical protein GGTG_00013 [Gaeumannomyces tritici R3-111a-1]|uniref:Uncharacterized protein n=1 Tax=Gaeumannomyces tritici (strain R3-111a-1) TaxID=644352 RepID=J3NFG7_GAET3|nr:hypothetical protein GGTG_00013 [Gaeumannomyces tritici R3-111a-1]EJT80007.1 hypothetical protein GGTG_00013 [Gaeumannomyces tritici R3-111a-1]